MHSKPEDPSATSDSETGEVPYPHLDPIRRAIHGGLTERQSKGYRTTRRRIRSLFGGGEQLSQVAITVGEQATPRGRLYGFSMRVSGQSRKAVDATEGYCTAAGRAAGPALAVIRALADVYLLGFQGLHVDLYVISPASLALCTKLFAADRADVETGYEACLHRLLHGIERATVQPCVKGYFFDRMMNKLGGLRSGTSNEVREFDFEGLCGRVLALDEGGVDCGGT